MTVGALVNPGAASRGFVSSHDRWIFEVACAASQGACRLEADYIQRPNVSVFRLGADRLDALTCDVPSLGLSGFRWMCLV